MVVVRLKGGLGNQMFQYAAGRRLAWKRGVPLTLDTSWYERTAMREYQLGMFNTSAGLLQERRTLSKLLPERLLRRFRGSRPMRVREADSQFDSRILQLPAGVVLDGYWQSERYFADAEAVIRHELTLRHPPTGRNRELAEEIAATPTAVSVHVRRGDYVTNPEANRIMGTCDLNYYSAAVDHLLVQAGRRAESASPPKFFVFTDDPRWARECLRLPGSSVIVDHNGPGTAYEDLRLMSLCHHHVIANSTFSWWGAWLAFTPDQIVVAPKQWYRAAEYSDADLIPDGWLRI